VARGRGLALSQAKALADGDVHIASKAKQLGLIDDVCTFGDVLRPFFQEQANAYLVARAEAEAKQRAEQEAIEQRVRENRERRDREEQERIARHKAQVAESRAREKRLGLQ
jgi:ClpP class serine protease